MERKEEAGVWPAMDIHDICHVGRQAFCHQRTADHARVRGQALPHRQHQHQQDAYPEDVGLATIHLDSNDRDLSSFDIINIRHGTDIKEMLSETVEKERLRNRVSSRELMVDADDDIDGDGIPD